MTGKRAVSVKTLSAEQLHAYADKVRRAAKRDGMVTLYYDGQRFNFSASTIDEDDAFVVGVYTDKAKRTDIVEDMAFVNRKPKK
jgi:hypothetical protein